MPLDLRCAIFLAAIPFTPTAEAQDASIPRQTLPTVEVQGRRGTAAEDYRVDRLDSAGPLGTARLLDQPYTLGVLPQELIENSQAKNFKEVSKYLPLVSFQEQQGPQILRPQTRGMQGGNFQNSRQDGMTMYVTVAEALEQFQQIEVLNGVPSSVYGPANPSGMFNFISKRPTDTTQRRVTMSYDSGSIGTLLLDMGGRADDKGVIAYRVNLLAADGRGYVGGSKLHRNLGDLAVDIRPGRDTVIETNYSEYQLRQKGYPGWFTYGQAIVLPSAPDASRQGYGQSFAGVTMDTRTATVRVKHDFNANWHLVAGILNQDASRDINTPVNNLTSNAGAYTSSLAAGFAPRFLITSDMASLNGSFKAGGFDHELVVGTAGYKSQSFSVTTAAAAANLLLGTASIANPVTFNPPRAGLPNTRLNYDSSTIYQQGVNVADTVHFNDAWAVKLGVSQDWFHVGNWTAQGLPTPGYSNSGASPTASLIWKPRKDITTYATWASSLQAGDIAPGTAINSGTGLAPYRSKQVEVGAKATVGGVDLSAAVFRIERPFANTDPADRVFKISGDQVNRGIEFTAIGQLIDRVTIYGGVTLLDAKLQKTGLAATNGKTFVGAPRYKGNVLVEYRIPGIDGLVGTFDWQYSARRAGNDINSFYVAGYNLFDLGARYASKIMEKNVVFRVAVNNLANRPYWSTVAPSNLTGANTGNLLAHLGAPRTLAASATIDF